jgi:translocation and assembly module TamB
MPRRRTVVLASAATLLSLGGFLAGGVAMATRTAWGLEQIRSYAERRLNAGDHRKYHIGRISGSLFTNLVVDSFSLRETNDSLFIATGPVRLSFDPRDLWDRRIVVRSAVVERPVVHVRQDSLGNWNYRTIFPSGPPGPPRTTRNFGDFIVVRDVSLNGGEFHLTMPWRPADSLSGARRDSAITFALGRKDKHIRRVGSHFAQTRSWTEGRLIVPYARIADPDSLGRIFELKRLDVNEFDPPMRFANAEGTVRIVKDSMWAEISHFEMPGSRGSATGKVWWGSDLPTRYDLTIRGDSVSLADVAWVYPTLPTSGGGSMTLAIRNQRDLRVLDYALSDLDVRTMRSRLRGNMTFGVGASVLQVKDVRLSATPIDWALIERLSGDELPYPWRGAIAAQVEASGGPVNRFRVESSSFAFVDANVSGATARGRASGELDILFPGSTKFHAFQVELDHLDLATLQFLNPNFPRLDGSISGRATLDSLWLDTRFHDADITHHFLDAPTSRFTGSGRATVTDKFIAWDVALNADPIQLTSIARAWPELDLEQRGELRGSVRAEGTADDLALSLVMRGGSGEYAFDGRVDLDSLGGYGWNGSLRFANANLRALYDTVAMPVTSLNGMAELNITGDSVENYRGTIDLQLQRSLLDSLRVYDGSRARLGFDDGLLRITDTVVAETSLGALRATGALGLRADRPDSMTAWVVTESLEGLRPYWLRLAGEDTAARRIAESDSLQGTMTVRALLRGSVDTLGVEAELEGREVMVGTTAAREVRARTMLANATDSLMAGVMSLRADSASLGTITLSAAALDATVRSSRRLDARAQATMTNGTALESEATVERVADSTRIRLSGLSVAFEEHTWSLRRPAFLTLSPADWSITDLTLGAPSGASVSLAGRVPTSGEATLRMRADSVALADLARLAQSRVALAGTMGLAVDVTGTARDPVMDIRGALAGTAVGEVKLSQTEIRGTYANRRLLGNARITRNDTTILDVDANVPMDLALENRARRLLDDSLRVTLRSRDVDLGIAESFSSALADARGRMNANLSLAGRRGSEALDGYLRVDQAAVRLPAFGLSLRDLNVDVVAERDTARIRRFVVTSGQQATDTLGLSGWIAREPSDWAFDLRLRSNNFEAVNSRRIGRLDVSSDVQLAGKTSGSVLGGRVTVNSGSVVIPELSQKKIVDLANPDLSSIVDTALAADRRIFPRTPSALARNLTVRNLQVEMGNDVWLRSIEANIKLGGRVNVINGTGLATPGVPQLALEGALQTERGTFNLRIGDIFVQRLFTLEGGEIRFLGDPDFNPDLDIRALYTVRQSATYRAANDVRVRLRVLGTLVQPRIAIESADSLGITDSDLYSYLIAGRPSSEIGGLSYGWDFLLANVSSGLSNRYSRGFFDVIRFQTFGRDTTAFSLRPTNLFEGAQLGVGKQLNDRTFVHLTAGLCRFFATGANVSVDQDIFGVTFEHRFARDYGLTLSREPPVEALLCQSSSARGFSAGQSQFGVDLFRAWRW